MSKCVYIAGPMTGFPQFNVPLFDAVAESLRADGYTVVSPAELDSDAVRTAAMASLDGAVGPGGQVANETWGDMLSRDVKLLADGHVTVDGESGSDMTTPVDGIVLLPGWENSRGARLEAFVGLLTGKEYFSWSPTIERLVVQSAEWVQHRLALAWEAAIIMHSPIWPPK